MAHKRIKKIWVMYCSRKGGHTYPSLAFYDHVKEAGNGQFVPEIMNLLDYSPTGSRTDAMGRLGDLKLKGLFKSGYKNLQKQNEVMLGGYRFAESMIFSMSAAFQKLKHRFGQPDIIVSLQPEVNVIAGRLKNFFNVPMHTIIIDLAVHGLWVNKAIDRYYVMNEPLRDELLNYRVPADRITVSGMPLRAGFSPVTKSDVKDVRRSLGLLPDKPTILVIGGLLGTMVDFHAAIRAIMKIESPVQVAVIFGKNEKDLIKAQDFKTRARWPLHLFGAVSNMHEFMWAADVIVSKPGSVTMAEGLGLGRPMVVITPRAGSAQEHRFAHFLKTNGAGEWVSSPDELTEPLAAILGSERRYRCMHEKAWELGHRSLNGTETIFKHVKAELMCKGEMDNE